MTGIEQAHAQLVDALRSYRDVLTTETEAVDLVLGTLDGGPPPKPKATFAPRKKPGPKPKAKKAAKKASAKKPTPKKRAAPIAADEPRVGRGKLPTKGVETYAPDSAAERQKKVAQLRADGYTRVGPGQPIAPGCFDVRENDDHGVVLWRLKAEAAE